MAGSTQQERRAKSGDSGAFGFHLLRIAGIDVHVHWSLLIIFAIIAMSLAVGVFPLWHPDWGALTSWVTAVAAALLFLVSVLVHELSHALVGRAQGIEVRRITLFLFGGMAHMDREPHAWSPELWMAIVGPITSFALGVGFTALGYALAGPIEMDPEQPQAALSMLGPGATLLFWLGPVNIVLALFNLVPGFPLDGGRVLRAILWGGTGNFRLATRWASRVGRAFALFLMLCGVAMAFGFTVPFFGTGIGGGLWLILIGWFLHNAAVVSYQQLVIQDALRNVTVGDLARTPAQALPPEATIRSCVDEHLVKGGRKACLVAREGRFAGVVRLSDARKVPEERWDTTPVRDVMTPADEVATTTPEGDGADAFAAMSEYRVDELPVVRDGRLYGALRRDDLVRWLRVYGGDAVRGGG